MAISGESMRFSFQGRGGTLFGIHLVNLFFTIITLGVYNFWARVKVRQYLWGQFEVAGDRLSYHGTGKEMLLGWLKAAVIFFIPLVVLQNGPKWVEASPAVMGVGALLSLLLIAFFFPVAIVGTRRYRLSRTAWRSIRFSFRGTWKQYFALSWKGNLLNLITLSLYSPYYNAKRDKFLISHSFVGNRNFDYDGKGEDLFWSYLICLVLVVPTLGFSWIWYFVKRMCYVWDHTTFGEARFASTVTFGGMVGVSLTNLLLVLVTLGFGFPWAEVRYLRYLSDNLNLNGPADFDSLAQDARAVNATGEELGSFLDLQFDLG